MLWALVMVACGDTTMLHASGTTSAPGPVHELPWSSDPPAGPALARAASIAALGQRLFQDPALSASGRMACATCHDPAHGFSPANALPVQRGGPDLDQSGTRAVPGLTYLSFRPVFAEHFHEADDEGDESVDAGPTGGLGWDGRIDRVRDQARVPLLSGHEMANESPGAVVAKVRAAPYADDMRAIHGDAIFDDAARAFDAITEALEFYLQEPTVFAPFTSKYDAFLRGKAKLNAAEQRGLAAFNDPDRGNCAHCHRSAVTPPGNLPLFTDFGLIAIGVPRNKTIPANADPAHYDLGLCGPDRRDHLGQTEYCGLFMTPTLRNVALRQSFFHNGVLHSLRDVVAFYAERDEAPQKWYPLSGNGSVRTFDDLPAIYHGNINREPPFNRHAGDTSPLSVQEIEDIVSFLQTLTDGYNPAGTANSPAAP